MSDTVPGDKVADAVALAEDDCWADDPDADDITAVFVVRIQRPGGSVYRIGAAPGTTLDDAMQIVKMTAVTVGGLSALRSLNASGGAGTVC